MAKTNAGVGIEPEILEAKEESQEMAHMKEMLRQITEQNRALVAALAGKDHTAPGSADERTAASKERYGIVVDEGAGPNDPPEVPVQVNGRAYQIKRGQYVEVPKEVVGVLNDAVIDRSIAQFDAMGMPNGITVRPQRRFPFQNYGLVINAAGERVADPMSTAQVA